MCKKNFIPISIGFCSIAVVRRWRERLVRCTLLSALHRPYPRDRYTLHHTTKSAFAVKFCSWSFRFVFKTVCRYIFLKYLKTKVVSWQTDSNFPLFSMCDFFSEHHVIFSIIVHKVFIQFNTNPGNFDLHILCSKEIVIFVVCDKRGI